MAELHRICRHRNSVLGRVRRRPAYQPTVASGIDHNVRERRADQRVGRPKCREKRRIGEDDKPVAQCRECDRLAVHQDRAKRTWIDPIRLGLAMRSAVVMHAGSLCSDPDDSGPRIKIVCSEAGRTGWSGKGEP